MLKIHTEVFLPNPEDPEFKVHLRPMSYLKYEEMLQKTHIETPSDAPEELLREARTKSGQIYMRELFKNCVVLVEGVSLDGRNIETGPELLDLAPMWAVNAIAKKAMEILQASESERKK